MNDPRENCPWKCKHCLCYEGEIKRLHAENKKLKALEKADAKEIGSYRKRTGLRGDFRIQQDKIIEQMDRIDELERVLGKQ